MENFFSYFHILLHILLPLAIAAIFFKKNFTKAFLIMLAANLIDLDHLLADPIYDPGRCSIGFHPLHSYPAIVVYVLMFLIPNNKIKIFSLGLLLHIGLDWLDCHI